MSKDMDYRIARTDAEIKECFAIRRAVFINEQSCPEAEEFDTYDSEAVHFLAMRNNEPAGTARLRFLGKKAKFERLAVLKAHRGCGIGCNLLNYVLRYIDELGYKETVIHAQSYLCDFYQNAGFISEGDEFIEAGIKHYLMKRI